MAASPANPNQTLVTLWVVQLITTVVITGVVLVFFRSVGPILKGGDTAWPLYALYAATALIIPPILYLRNFKEVLDVDREAVRKLGKPDPAIRAVLTRALAVGCTLADLPQALGVLHLLMGGETRWFLGSALVTLALKLSYRPFERLR